MDRPRVIIHNLISLDGRLDGFPADVGLYYELAARLQHQAVLTGSGTILAAAASQGIDMAGEDPPPPPGPPPQASARKAGEAPLLVAVDSCCGPVWRMRSASSSRPTWRAAPARRA